jgi:hypothetical protein
MNKISYSQLSMFSECPLRWKLNYIDDLSVSEPSIHLLFGTAMHEVIQKYLEVMYFDSVKNANKLNLEQRLHDKMMEQFKIDKEAYGKDPCTLEQLREFFQDGVEILDFIKRKRGEYFSKRGYKLIGCEVPIEVMLKKNIKMVGYLDLVILDEVSNTLKIYDIKTSTRGWNKWMKKDEKFSPASGKPSMNKVAKRLNTFLDLAFDDNGERISENIVPTPSKKACKFCEFKKTEYCEVGI